MRSWGMPRRPQKRDDFQNALAIVEQAIGSSLTKNPAAVALGRRGGLKGGNARAKALNTTQRREIAQKAAKARWASKEE